MDRDYLSFLKPNDFFNQEEIQSLLQIPHKKIEGDLFDVFDFDIAENKNNWKIPRIKILKIKKAFNDDDFNKNKKVFYGYGVYDYEGELYYFQDLGSGNTVVDFILSLEDYDKEKAMAIHNRLLDLGKNSEEVFSSSNKVFTQTKKIKEYLCKNHLLVKNLNINIDELLVLSSKNLTKKIKDLTEQFGGVNYNFPAYNDLDLCPFMFEDIFVITDSASTNIYLLKEEDDISSWYCLRRDYYSIKGDTNDEVSEFLYDTKQNIKEYFNFMNDLHLVVRFKNEQVIQASPMFEELSLSQSCIFKDLLENNLIELNEEQLSFMELLRNYTVQNEIYQIEERALIDLLPDLIVNKGIVSYEDFSRCVINLDEILHEDFTSYSLKSLKEKDLSNLLKLPNVFKKEINNYLDDLVVKAKNVESYECVSLIKKALFNGLEKTIDDFELIEIEEVVPVKKKLK